MLSIVKGKRSANSAKDAKPVHEGLGAMVPRAHGNAELVEKRTHVHVMDVAHVETHHGIVGMELIVRSVDMHAVNGGETLEGVSRELALVTLYVVHAETLHIVYAMARPWEAM